MNWKTDLDQELNYPVVTDKQALWDSELELRDKKLKRNQMRTATGGTAGRLSAVCDSGV
jgi:hypothetical protein